MNEELLKYLQVIHDCEVRSGFMGSAETIRKAIGVIEKQSQVTCCEKHNSCKRIKHVFKEGSRRHVIFWDSNGRRCSETACEINCKKGE